MKLILASTSTYRADLLKRLRLPFVQMDPVYDEIPLAGETAAQRCRRLARGKALSLASQQPASPYLIIASDQVVSLKSGEILGKPGNFDAAHAQLKACAGAWVTYETAICLLTDGGRERVESESVALHFRTLDDAAITRYLNLEAPWNAAGSIKLESLGISLVDDSRGRDINTVLGLPLMLLVEMLQGLEIDVLNEIN